MSTYGDIGTRAAAYAEMTALAHAEPVTVLAKLGVVKPLPKNKTDTIKFNRPVPFAAVTAPLAEGVTPVPGGMTYDTVTVQLKEWGDLRVITDKVEDLSEDPVLQHMAMLSGEQAALTQEMIIWSKLKAGTNVAYANGANRAAVNTAISLDDQRKAVRYLQSMKAKPINKVISPSVNIGTRPVEAGYVALCHTDLQADIRDMAGFTPVAEYGNRTTISDREFGSVEDVRYITSPEFEPWSDAGGLDGDAVLSTSGTNADVYPVVYLGQDAFGLVPLKGMGSIPITVLNPGRIDKSDPLGQRGYVGWKMWFNATILNQTWIYRVEVAASEL